MAAQDHLGQQFLDLYHHTSPEAAEEIKKTGHFKSLEGTSYSGRGTDAYFTTHKGSEYASGFGPSVVHIQYPAKGAATLVDEFPSGEQHYAIPTHHIRKSYIKDD